MTTVVAPAGYGKSVLVAQWHAGSNGRQLAWIDLGAGDDDAVHFTRTLIAALSAVHPDLGTGADRVDIGGRRLGEDLVEQLVANLSLVPDVVIVFDNFEAIRSPELVGDIAALVELAPSSTHFVFISRSDPDVGIGRLRVQGDLCEIRARDLSMSATEAVMLLDRAGVRLDDPQTVEQLVARTAGWPAALQLAALSMREMADPAGFVERFSGDDRHVADYLTEEVLATCSDDERRFIVDTSVLETLSGALCDHVTDGVGGHGMLLELERRGMLLDRLDPVDGPGECFRFHPLLRDLLRTELEAGDPVRHRQLLRRAAAWYRELDDFTTASDYLVRAHAWDDLLEFSRLHGQTCFEHGLITMLRSRLESVPEVVRLGSTSASLTLAILRLITGQAHAAERELTRLETANPLTPWERSIVDATRAAMVAWRFPPDRAVEAGNRVLDRIATASSDDVPPDVLGLTSVPSLEALTVVAVGRGLHYMGRTREARAMFVRSDERGAETYLPWRLHALGGRAVVEALDGELGLAEQLASDAVQLALEAGIESHPALAESRLAIAIVRREQDALTDAGFALRDVLGLARSNHREPLIGVHTSEAVRLALAAGGPDAVLDEVSESEIAHALAAEQPGFVAQMAATIAWWRLAGGDCEGAEAVLAEHEVRSTDGDAAAIATALVRRDVKTARRLLDRLSDDTTTRGRVASFALRAVADDLEGRTDTVTQHLRAAVELAEAADLRRVLLDLGPDVVRVLHVHAGGRSSPFVRSVLERQPAPPRARAGVPDLVEALTEREIAVLQYLPTRLSYGEIAEQLYVSVNTIKTHMKHIYRKLDAEGRSGAIARAEALGLL